jgi:hypothetical protein
MRSALLFLIAVLPLFAGHPRLVVNQDGLNRLRATLRDDAYARSLHTRLTETAERLCQASPVEYPGKRQRVLEQSRTALERIYTLALLYRLDGKRSYFDRAVRELRTVTQFPDWNPGAFLDVSEMMHAVSIGYDWLYAELSPDDRAAFRRAIVEKGIRIGLRDYERKATWTIAPHNTNQVGNVGMMIGALAVEDTDPELTSQVLKKARESIRVSMVEYAPDGGWKEGPMYWHYATRYTVWGILALESALGNDLGIGAYPGFSRTGDFRIHAIGPAGRYFNFGDCHESAQRAWEMWWLADRFKMPAYAAHQKQMLESVAPQAMDLVCYRTGQSASVQKDWPLDRVFAVDAAFFRSAWDDPKALYFAIKGGNRTSAHYHADAGSFVLDAGGVRWAADLGGDTYGPEYFDRETGGKRWEFYRPSTRSHNTLVIDGINQDPLASAPVIEQTLAGATPMVRIDLSRVNPGVIRSWIRTVTLPERSRVVLDDELVASRPVQVVWGMLTPAQIVLDGAVAKLRKGGQSLTVRVLQPAGARFEVESTQPPPPQNPNAGTRRLIVRLPEKVEKVRLVVELTPVQ